MSYITDLTFVSGLFVMLTFATIIMLQVIKALASAISLKMKKPGN